MSIEKSHFLDRIEAVLASLGTLFEPCGSNQLEEGKHGTLATCQSAAFCGLAKIGQHEVCMIGLKLSRSESVRLAAAFLAVSGLAPKVLAQQQNADLCLFATGGKTCGGKAADLQDRSRYLADGTLGDSRHAVCSPVRRNSISGESGRADGSGGSEVHATT